MCHRRAKPSSSTGAAPARCCCDSATVRRSGPSSPWPAPGETSSTRTTRGRTCCAPPGWGGLTLFTSERPGGAPAAYAGDGPTIRPVAVGGTNALFQTLVQSSIRASRAAQHLIVFEAPDLSPKDTSATASAILADAASVTAEAFTRLAGRGPTGRTVVARVARVQFQTGRDAEAKSSGTVVTITVSPEKGFAGRPSSARIITTLMKK